MASASRSSACQDLVKTSLSAFATKHIPDASIEGVESTVDEIVLSYMLGVLEELGSDDGFEVDSFVEMMQAYIPGFQDVSSDSICDWIFKLADELATVGEKNDTSVAIFPSATMQSSMPRPIAEVNKGQRSIDGDVGSDRCDGTVGDAGSDDVQVRQLLEMFPASCSVDAQRCLATANGQMEDAVQLMLLEVERQEAAPTITKDEWNSRRAINDDKKVRDSILQKYGYVDIKDDSTVHKPVAPKQDKKKMVRYLNNQVCTTKGERFIEIKKPMTEEMKKTYINLKPARSYHFH